MRKDNRLNLGDIIYTIDRNRVMGAVVESLEVINKGLVGVRNVGEEDIYGQDEQLIYEDRQEAQEYLSKKLRMIENKRNYTHEIIGVVEPVEALVDGVLIVDADQEEVDKFTSLGNIDKVKYLRQNGRFKYEDVSFNEKGEVTLMFTNKK